MLLFICRRFTHTLSRKGQTVVNSTFICDRTELKSKMFFDINKNTFSGSLKEFTSIPYADDAMESVVSLQYNEIDLNFTEIVFFLITYIAETSFMSTSVGPSAEAKCSAH